jgi:hypothetical protein
MIKNLFHVGVCSPPDCGELNSVWKSDTKNNAIFMTRVCRSTGDVQGLAHIRNCRHHRAA